MNETAAKTPEWRHGWPVVLGSAAMAGVGAGLYQNLSSLFMPGLQQLTGASRGEIGSSAALGLLGAFAAPLIGRLADRFGVVPIIVLSALGVGAAHVWLSLMSGGGLWQFMFGVALLAISSPGMSALIYGRLVALRFNRHRGLALAFATSGISLTTVLLPAAIGWVIANWGIQAGYHVLAALAVGVGIPAGIYASRKAGVPERPTQRERSMPPSWKNLLFWRIGGATMLINIGTVGMVTSLALIGAERGLGLAAAGLLLSSYGASQIVGRILMGALIDRFAVNRIAAAFGLVSAAGFFGMQWGFDSLPFMLAAVFVAGLLNGAEYDLLPFLVSRLFPLGIYGELFGRLYLLSLLASGVGLAGYGLLHDWTGSYAAPLGIGTICMLLAATLLYTLPPTRPHLITT